MTALIVLFMFLAFVALDYGVRTLARKSRERKAREERAAVLEVALNLTISDEAPSLKRVEVPEPRARVLAVDDEPVVLDAFRRILVMEGFNVDTVQSGPEALGLVQRRDYDFVFTDLKMPDMDGVEVVKAVHHLRPDLDIVVVTGYATIESAVETMKHGATEYVQKPFSVEELTDFARRLLIKREARLEALRRPVVRVMAPAMAEGLPASEHCLPGGTFLSRGHAWARLEGTGHVQIGIDDLLRPDLARMETLELPKVGQVVRQGDPLVVLLRGGNAASLRSPVSGKVMHVNAALTRHPGLAAESPYERGWFCTLEPSDLSGELPSLLIGQPALAWYQEEIARYRKATAERPLTLPVLQDEWLRG